ncbi:MAG: hypothetical protein WC365_08855 [Candidatus Babeliales bacterium]
MKLTQFLSNLPWRLKEVFICDLFGHQPAPDLEFVKNLTICERCMAPLKKNPDGSWRGHFALIDFNNQMWTQPN